MVKKKAKRQQRPSLPKTGINIYIDRAEKQKQQGKLEDAIATLKQAVSLDARNSELQFRLGRLFIEHKDISSGIKSLEKAIEINPEYFPALIELGQIYLKNSVLEIAYSLTNRALKAAPDNADVQFAYASVCQRQGGLETAIDHYRKAIELQIRKPLPTHETVKNKEEFDKPETEQLMWETLEVLAKNGIHAFPAFGTLLGLEREGGLLPFDKDLDFGIPFSEMDRACKILTRHGWGEVSKSYGLVNPRAFYNKEVKVSVDLFGMTVERTSGIVISGVWKNNIPKNWNLIAEYPDIDLVKYEYNPGRYIWKLKSPADFLTAAYGNWKVPDKNFESLVSSKNIRSFSLMVQCYAFSKVLNSLKKGNYQKLESLLASLMQRMDKDPLLDKLTCLTKDRLQDSL